jgi:hypothetical protein
MWSTFGHSHMHGKGLAMRILVWMDESQKSRTSGLSLHAFKREERVRTDLSAASFAASFFLRTPLSSARSGVRFGAME